MTADEGEPEHPDSSLSTEQQRRERRMRVTGMVGVVAAVLGLGVVGTAIALPDPDPLAVFERAETQADRDAAALLAQGFIDDITLGPRAIDVGEGIVAVVFRTAAVADGRSTEYDPYCLFTTAVVDDEGGSISGGACAVPERFAAEGLIAPARASASGVDFDVVVWGPVGQPRVELDRALDSVAGPMSALDWMIYSSFAFSETDPLAVVDDPDSLLLGPTSVPIIRSEASSLDIETVAYLRGDVTDSAGPTFCAHTTVPDEGETRACTLLSTVRRQGLEYTITADGREWIVSIGADGAGREDTLRVAD